jgi:iron-sulfur cluster assembly accessory protein
MKQVNESVTLTPAAILHFHEQIAKQGKGIGIRLSIKTVGCSGKKYDIELIDEAKENDLLFKSGDLMVYVDKESYTFVKGMQIDYGREGLNYNLIFHNPNVKNVCGCGESFNF